MSLRHQILVGLKWQGLATVGRNLISFVVFTTLARLLSPSDFGLMGLTYIYTTIFGILAELGIRTALIQRHSIDRSHLDTAFCFLVSSALLLSFITLTFSEFLATLFGDIRLAPILCLSSLVLIIRSITAIHETLFSRDLEFRAPAVRTLIGTSFGGIVGVSMALLGHGVWSLVGQQIGGALIESVFTWTASSYRPSLHFSISHLRELANVSASAFANTMIWLFTSRIDQIVLGRASGVSALGQYLIAFKLPELLRLAIQQPIDQLLLPALAKLQHDRARLHKAIYNGIKLNAIATFAIFGGLAVTANDVIPLAFSPKWSAASPLCAVLSLNSLVTSLQIFTYPVLVASGCAGAGLMLGILNALGVTAACVIGVQFGVFPLTVALLVNTILQIGPNVIALHRKIGISVLCYFQCLTAPSCAALMMFIAVESASLVFHLDTPSWSRLLVRIFIGAFAYLLGLYISDRRIFLEILNLAKRQGTAS